MNRTPSLRPLRFFGGLAFCVLNACAGVPMKTRIGIAVSVVFVLLAVATIATKRNIISDEVKLELLPR